MSTQREFRWNDGPAVRRFIDAGISQEQRPRLLKVGDSDQLKAPCKSDKSCIPKLHVDDAIILGLLYRAESSGWLVPYGQGYSGQ